MLPPFVPPSARVPSESLPLITEFVIEHVAHTVVTTSAPPTAATPPRGTGTENEPALPSIDEFLMEPPRATEQHGQSAQQGKSAQQQPAASQAGAAAVEPGPRPSDQPESGIPVQELEREEGEPLPRADTVLMPTPVSVDASEVKESAPPGARFNDEAADSEVEAPGITRSQAWDASAVSPAAAGQEAAERAEASTSAEGEHDVWGEETGVTMPSQSADAAWVAEERDSFDWQSVGSIAAGPDETRRAEEAWAGTEWESRRNPEHEQVATALVQLARRVRAGEVKVDLPSNATVEASLAAVLAALLADGDR